MARIDLNGTVTDNPRMVEFFAPDCGFPAFEQGPTLWVTGLGHKGRTGEAPAGGLGVSPRVGKRVASLRSGNMHHRVQQRCSTVPDGRP